MTRGRLWVREELLAVLYLYIKYRDELTTPRNHPLVKNVAKAMDRTVGSIAKRIQNYKSVDPAYTGRGLKAGGPYITIWSQYESDPGRLMSEARCAYQEFMPNKRDTL